MWTRLAWVSLLLASCGGDADVVTARSPSPEQRKLRQAFVESQPRLDRALVRQVLDFEIEPEDALRRQSYVDQRPDLPARLRAMIVRGQFALGVRAEHVEAAWGPPDFSEPRDDGEIWRYSRSAGPYHPRARRIVLTFTDGLLVDIRESSD